MREDGRGGEEKGAEMYEFNHTPNYVMVLTGDPTFEWRESGLYSGHLLVSSPPVSLHFKHAFSKFDPLYCRIPMNSCQAIIAFVLNSNEYKWYSRHSFSDSNNSLTFLCSFVIIYGAKKPCFVVLSKCLINIRAKYP